MIPPWDQQGTLVAMAQGLPALPSAVVHPCDDRTIAGVLEAAGRGLIQPVLVGPRDRIMDAAATSGRSLDKVRIVDVPHSHAAVQAAADLARAGEVGAILRGTLRIEELMEGLVAPAAGLRTGHRMSHVHVLDANGCAKPLLVTDALINIRPNLEAKEDIVLNAVGLAHALGIERPRVAILSAADRIRSRLPATLDAAALCKMAERGQISGAVVDGPMGFDSAISVAAAAAKGIVSEVAGNADILVAHDLEAASMIATQLIALGGAEAAGLVLGARVPVILTGPAETPMARLASCALARIYVSHSARKTPHGDA